jgi:hypothetical protein
MMQIPRRAKMAALLMLILASSLLGGQQAGAQPQDQQTAASCFGPVFVKNPYSNTFLDVEGSSTADGARVLSFPYTGNLNQQWTFCDLDDDGLWDEIKPRSDISKCLDVYDSSWDPGQLIIQFRCTFNYNQAWYFVLRPDFNHALINYESGLALDLWQDKTPKQLGQYWFEEHNELQAWVFFIPTPAGTLEQVTPPRARTTLVPRTADR